MLFIKALERVSRRRNLGIAADFDSFKSQRFGMYHALMKYFADRNVYLWGFYNDMIRSCDVIYNSEVIQMTFTARFLDLLAQSGLVAFSFALFSMGTEPLKRFFRSIKFMEKFAVMSLSHSLAFFSSKTTFFYVESEEFLMRFVPLFYYTKIAKKFGFSNDFHFEVVSSLVSQFKSILIEHPYFASFFEFLERVCLGEIPYNVTLESVNEFMTRMQDQVEAQFKSSSSKFTLLLPCKNHLIPYQCSKFEFIRKG